MKWYQNYVGLGVLLIILNSNHAMSKRPQDQPGETKPVTVMVNEKSSSVDAPVTFLDTLNKGKEISLSERDYNSIIPESTDASGAKDSREMGVEGYRIQCFASSQIERIRTEQKTLETKVKYPLYIVFTPPYYKLLMGDFLKRADADIILTRLKEMGYNDAWVVRTKVMPTSR